MTNHQTSKWNRAFLVDLAERVGSTFLGALLATLTLVDTTPVNWGDAHAVWAVLGVPTLVSLIKGLLANMANPDTGAAIVAADTEDELEPAVRDAYVD